jgi:hypothetical protein
MKYSFGSAMLKAVLSNVTTVLISEVMVPKTILTLRKNQARHGVEISNNGRKATCRKEVWFEHSEHSNNRVSARFPSLWE